MNAMRLDAFPVPLFSARLDAVRAATDAAHVHVIDRQHVAKDLARMLDVLSLERATHIASCSWCLSHRDQGRCKRLRTLRRAIRSNQRRFADAIGALRRLGGG
jgi:hypothetical protein